jgi:hypothetical protein
MSGFEMRDRVRIVRLPTEWESYHHGMADCLSEAGEVIGLIHFGDEVVDVGLADGSSWYWPVDCLTRVGDLPAYPHRLDDVHALLTSRTGWTVDTLSSELRAIGACDPGLCGEVAAMLLVGAL